MLSLAVRTTIARTFSTGARVRKDFVQELYVKELKNYTPAALSKDAHLGQVKAFSPVAVPTAPVIPAASDLAAELAAYDSVAAAPAAVPSATLTEASVEGADQFLAHVQADLKHEAAH